MMRRFTVGALPAALMMLSMAPLPLLCLITTSAIAQQQTAAIPSRSELPDAPSAVLDQQSSSEQAPPGEGSASVFGVVLDVSGATVAGAQVSLTDRTGSQRRNVKSGANGEFTFTALPAGSYLVIVEASGFQRFTSTEFPITAQQAYAVPKILLPVATANTVVNVRPAELIAAEPIRAEEKQRLIGVVPNFYVSYVHDAVPLTSKQKFSLASHDTFDWSSFVGVSAAAGIEQANNSFSGYGQGAAGYAKRWAAKFADGRSSPMPRLAWPDARVRLYSRSSWQSASRRTSRATRNRMRPRMGNHEPGAIRLCGKRWRRQQATTDELVNGLAGCGQTSISTCQCE